MDKTERTREQAIISATQLGIQVTQGYPIEMHKVFHAWVAWGFYTSIFFMSIFIFSVVLMKYKERAGQVLSAVNFGFQMTNFVVWIVLGTVWRFSTAGSIAAGSKLEKPAGMTDDSWSEQLKTAVE
jgi:bacteriorhodopsin